MDWSEVIFWGNTLQDYVIAGVVLILLAVLFWFLYRYVFVWADNAIKIYKNKRRGMYAIAHAILRVPGYVLAVIAIYIALQFIVLPHPIGPIFSALFIVFVVFWGSSILSTFFMLLVTKLNEGEDEKSLDMTKNVVRLTIKIVIWTTAILLVLMNLGIQITPLLASLGIGGIAIAFALQNVLQDIFASFSIFLEKPFSIGDFVVVGDVRGVVQHVSFKSTYIQALEGQMVVVPNNEVMNTKVQNYGVMKRRWNKQTIGVLYETPLDKLQKVPVIIKEEIDRIDDITYHRAHVKELNAYSIDVEFAYHIESKEMLFFLDKNQELLMSILARFAEEGIGIAYPTQLVYTHPLNNAKTES